MSRAFVRETLAKHTRPGGTVDRLIGKMVTTFGGVEGTVVAVAYAEGGTGGWSLLLLKEDGRLAADAALNAQVCASEDA
jgi:hypothetical protein